MIESSAIRPPPGRAVARPDVLIFTKTCWNEQARIRHQVTNLLLDHDHQVTYFEKPTGIVPSTKEARPGLALVRHCQLIHHQLRVSPSLSRANAEFEKLQIRAHLAKRSAPDVIVNFNYDYFFLRELFPRARIVSVFNDDFIVAARWFSRREARRLVGATAKLSDHNLVVSYPLFEQIRQFSSDVSLFLPWARRRYQRPKPRSDRNETLYWGYINDRIDVPLVRSLLDRGLKVNFVGPVDGTERSASLLEHPNARYHGAGALEVRSDVVDRCASSILPYDTHNGQVQAVTASNRSFELLAWGLPLLFCELPGLIRAPEAVIHRCRSVDDFHRAHRESVAGFEAAQPIIETFLMGHSAEARYAQLQPLLGI